LSYSGVALDSVTLSWRAPVNAAAVAYYKIFKDGASVGQPTGTTDEVLGLRPATTYTFLVRAYNAAGEESPPSNSVIVTTTTPAIVFDVPSSVAFGDSFSVGGSGWPCADVRLYIAGNAVEIGKVDEFASFDAQITVHDQDGERGWVDFLSGGGRMQLTPGDWPMMATCPGGPLKSATLSVIDVPMVGPSTAAG
jgi:chitodextrinase